MCVSLEEARQWYNSADATLKNLALRTFSAEELEKKDVTRIDDIYRKLDYSVKLNFMWDNDDAHDGYLVDTTKIHRDLVAIHKSLYGKFQQYTSALMDRDHIEYVYYVEFANVEYHTGNRILKVAKCDSPALGGVYFASEDNAKFALNVIKNTYDW